MTWDPNRFAQIVGRPPTQQETAFYQNVPTWETDVMNAAGGGAPTAPGQTGTGYQRPSWLPAADVATAPPPAGPGTTQWGTDPTTQALLENYKSLGKTPTGAGSGPTDLAYFAKRIAETGGLTDANKAYWFGPTGRIAQELKGSVPAEGGGGGGGTTSAPRGLLPTGFGSSTLGQMAINPHFWWS